MERNKYSMIICNPTPLPERTRKAVARWVETQHSRLFAFVLSDTNLDRILIDKVYGERKLFNDIETLDVLLDSSGGSADAAYQFITFLRRRCKTLRIFVPDWAKSAATLLALGADEIWMSETAELGPLDVQITDPRDPHSTISALDEFRAIDHLRNHAYEIFDQMARMIIRRTRLKMRDVVELAIEFGTRIMEPLYAQIDPLYFGEAHRSLEISTAYGTRIMSRYAYKGWSAEKVQKVLRKLTWEYPSHPFVIDYDEAKQLGLAVHLLAGQLDDDSHTILDGVTECVGFLDTEVIPDLVPKPEALEVKTNGEGQQKPAS